MADLLGHSITYRVAVGARAGEKVFALQTVLTPKPWSASTSRKARRARRTSHSRWSSSSTRSRAISPSCTTLVPTATGCAPAAAHCVSQIAVAGDARAPAQRAGAVRVRGSQPRLLDSREERLVRDRHGAGRRRLCAAGAEARGYITRLGPLACVLRQLDERTRARVIEAVRAAFASYVHGDEVRFTAACWMLGARTS